MSFCYRSSCDRLLSYLSYFFLLLGFDTSLRIELDLLIRGLYKLLNCFESFKLVFLSLSFKD